MTQRGPATVALLALADDAGLAEHTEVVGQRRWRHRDGKGAARPLGVPAQRLNDRHAGGVGQGVEYVDQRELVRRWVDELGAAGVCAGHRRAGVSRDVERHRTLAFDIRRTTKGSLLTSMQAVVFDRSAPDTTRSRVVDIPVPEPGAGEIALDVRYAGVNFIDVMARRGDAGYVDSWPFVPGMEVAGSVRALGPGVEGLTVGDRVAAFTGAGGLAEVAIARAALVAPVPDSLGLGLAAAAPGALVTAALLVDDVARVRPGEAVLAHSASGGVGQALVQLARLAGATPVLGTVGRLDRVEAAARAGYDAAFARGPGLAEAVRAHTSSRGVDVVLDPQGTAMLDFDLEVAAPGARIVLFGNAAGAPLAPLPPAGRLFAANASLSGFSLSRLAAGAPERVTAALRRVLGHLAVGALEVELSLVAGLAGAPEAQQALAEGRGSGKQVVQVRSWWEPDSDHRDPDEALRLTQQL